MFRFFQMSLPHTQSTLAFGNDTKLASMQSFSRYVSRASLSPTTVDTGTLTTHNEGFPLLALGGDFQHIYLIPGFEEIKGWEPPEELSSGGTRNGFYFSGLKKIAMRDQNSQNLLN